MRDMLATPLQNPCPEPRAGPRNRSRVPYVQRGLELLRCLRTEFWTVRDLRMLTMGVDEWVQEFIDCELLAARYLKTARAAQGPKSLIADYTLWTPARQKELIAAAASLPRSWRPPRRAVAADRKSTRLNSSHVAISYAVFCLNKTIRMTRSIT